MMLGFDAEERLIQKLPHDFAEKVVWGSRYPHHDATSAWDAIASSRGQCAGGDHRPHDGRQRGPAIRHRAASRTGGVSSRGGRRGTPRLAAPNPILAAAARNDIMG